MLTGNFFPVEFKKGLNDNTMKHCKECNKANIENIKLLT